MNNKIIILVGLGVIAFCQAQDFSAFTQKGGIIDKQLNCILKIGPCDSIGKRLQEIIPEILNNNCARCAPHQKKNAVLLIEFLRDRYPNEWFVILSMYTSSEYLKDSKDDLLSHINHNDETY